jgi:hypothetical protein
MAKWFCGHGFAWAVNAARSFFCAPTVIAVSAIAASAAASKPESVSGVVPTGDINRVPKDGSIIATGSGNTAVAGRKRA